MSFDDRRAARIPGKRAELRIEIPREDAGIAPDAVMGEGRDRPGVRAIELDESRDAFPLQMRLIRHLVDDRVARRIVRLMPSSGRPFQTQRNPRLPASSQNS